MAPPHPAAPAAAGLGAVRTLAGLLAWRVAQTPEAEAYRQYDEARAAWAGTSWREFGERVQRFARALAALGLQRGDRVAILLPNSVDAVGVDQAVLALGCVPVPLHVTDNPGSIAYILGDSEASVLMADSLSHWQAIAQTEMVPAALRHVVVRQGEPGAIGGPPTVVSLRDWLAQGDAAPAASPAQVQEDDLAGLVYTSGTTGKPKGVMLTHANILSNVKAGLALLHPRVEDVFLSFLPLSHTFERTCGYYVAIACGACTAFARSVPQLPEDLLTVRPTILVSVPRIYERVYGRLQTMLEESTVKRTLFHWAQAVGWRRFCREHGLPVEGAGSAAIDAAAWPLLSGAVASRLQARFGGRLRLAISGGAALSQPIARTFLGLGIHILQGYGMTESSPVVSANTPGDNDPRTVGRPLEGVEVRIGENRELLVRGPNVMRGYWKRPQDTARAIDPDGWLHTGDQAALEDGRVRILGRVKEIIVTSTGEKIAPVDLETAIAADPLFEQAYCFGDHRPFIACLAVMGREPWERLCKGLGLDPDQPGSLANPKAVQAALARIRELTRDFPYYAQPRAIGLLREPWTVEDSLITPTLKLKRANLSARFASEIERLYQR
ncbi:AMP-dependent synthetase/ligase [Ramlibacter sp.]|uniref:AMP-dependent synthetase/ligase n=1 Tax=Ramlibacter sp. TaxID=1917967 RepID=UPI002FC58828